MTLAQLCQDEAMERLEEAFSEHRKLLQQWRQPYSYFVQPRMKWKVCRWSVGGFWLDAAAEENKVQQMWEQTKIKYNNKTLMLWFKSIPHTAPALLFIWLSFIWVIYFLFTRSHANSIKSHPPHSLLLRNRSWRGFSGWDVARRWQRTGERSRTCCRGVLLGKKWEPREEIHSILQACCCALIPLCTCVCCVSWAGLSRLTLRDLWSLKSQRCDSTFRARDLWKMAATVGALLSHKDT